MALLQDWLPPSRQNWELVVWLWQFFPLITLLQYSSFINRTIYTMGKTSSSSRFNIPGRIAWVTMELPGPLTLLYILSTLPASTSLSSLPLENKVLATLYVVHYLNRAIIAPLIAPSISPISPHVWAFAFLFQLSNGLSLGGWLGGYGPRNRAEWQAEANYKQGARMELGLMVFVLGFLGNLFHDDELREIRRAAARNQARLEAEKDEGTEQNEQIARSEKEDGVQAEKGEKKKQKKGVDKVYMIPQNGLFNYVLYPHYFFEWIEWFGFYLMCGMACVPARNFVVNEIATMLPRAISGKQWYIERFGKEKIGGKKAVIPGII